MIQDFWLLEDPYSSQPLESSCSYQSITCDAEPGHRRGVPVRLQSVTISNWPSDDFVWTWSSDILISERVLQVFALNRVTGFEARPIKVTWSMATASLPPKLFELVVTGWGGMASQKSGLRTHKYCPSCKHRIYSVAEPTRIVEPATWDGSDLFMIWPLPRFPFVSDRLARLIRESRFSGVELIPAADIPIDPGGQLTPGPLSDWMPEQRASELAEKFDVS